MAREQPLPASDALIRSTTETLTHRNKVGRALAPSDVVITGMGCVSSLGNTIEQYWGALQQGKEGVSRFEAGELYGSQVQIAAIANAYKKEEHFSSAELGLLDRHSQLALVAARAAVKDADLEGDLRQRAAIVLGTGCGGKHTDEETYQTLLVKQRKRVPPLTIPKGMPSAAVSQMSLHLGVMGPSFTVSSACASANHAIIQAMMLIRTGMADVVIAGGADAPLTYGLLKAWEAMRVLSPDGCRPFSADRNGLVLAEGAGVVVLESEAHARSRDARCYARLVGAGMSSDAEDITKPSARGAARAIEMALKDAGLDAGEVDYVNAHGTGTLLNDKTETEALHLVFGEHAGALMVSSTKSMHGHALGASGALELIATVKSIADGVIPPTINLSTAGEGCDLDYVPNSAREARIHNAISNSFAFGGLNAVLAVSSMTP